MKKLSEKIKEARLSLGFTQRDLSERIRVSDKTVSAYEQGRATPPISKIIKIAEETNLPLSFFVEDDPRSEIKGALMRIEQHFEDIKKLLNK